MRKPFLFLLIIFSFWIWSLDLVDILFYYAKKPYGNITGDLIAIIPFAILIYLFTKLFLSHYELNKNSFVFSKARFKEYIYLLVFFIPVLYLNFTRIMFPDINYDEGSYHLYLQQLNRYENLKNFNMVGTSGGGTYFFTLSYKMFGAFRKLLGFRMGAIFNTLLIFTCYVAMYDFLKVIVKSYTGKLKTAPTLLALCCLFIIYADNTLIVLNTYMVDLVGIPLLLELLFIALFKKLNPENGFTTTLFFFVLASLIIAYKLTYLPYIFVLALFFIIRNYSFFIQRKSVFLLGTVTLFFPAVYLLYNYTETQNPIFPLYNKLFKSPLYPIINFKDERWGPHNIWETFYFNIACAIDKKRCNEWGFFSVRLLTEYFLFLSCSIYLIVNKFRLTGSFIKLIISVSVIALLLNYTLLLTTGYYRYGVIIEMLFGLCIILWLLYFFHQKKYLFFYTLLILSSVQCVNTFNTIYKHGTNFSWYEYSNLRQVYNGRLVKEQVHMLFKDKQPGIDSILYPLKIDGFFHSDCDGYARLLSPAAPIYNVTSYGNREKIIRDFEKNVVDTFSEKHNLYFLSRQENYDQNIKDLNSRYYVVDTIVKIYPAFTFITNPLFLFKIRHDDHADSSKNFIPGK